MKLKALMGLTILLILLPLLAGCLSDPYYRALEEGDMEVVRSVAEGDLGEAQRIPEDRQLEPAEYTQLLLASGIREVRHLMVFRKP